MVDIVRSIGILGKLVRFHRNKAGLTQVQLADLAGVGKSTVFDIEKGKSTVQINSLLAVLDAVNIDVKFSGPLSAAFEKCFAAQSSDKRGTALDRR